MEGQSKRKKQFLELGDELKKAQEFIKVKNKKICQTLRKCLRRGPNCQSPIFKGSIISRKGHKGPRYNYRSYLTLTPGHDRGMYLKNLWIFYSFLGREKGEMEEKKPGRNYSPQNYKKQDTTQVNPNLEGTTRSWKTESKTSKPDLGNISLSWGKNHLSAGEL